MNGIMNEMEAPLILVVDDTPMSAEILKDMLEEKGYRTILATSGGQALEFLKTEQPNLILLDIMMPGMDGYEFCGMLKEDDGTRDIPVIFLTSKTETGDIVKGFRIGAVDYVTKPFKAEELLARISTHLSMVRMKKRLEFQNKLLAERNNVIEHQLALARKIQQQFIPKDDPDENIASFYKPMDTVGGDFYDFLFFREKGELGIFISDVSGHGVPAAFITSMEKTVLLQAGAVRENPAHLLSYLNSILYDNTDKNFLTAFYGIFNFKKRSLRFANAGHNPPLLITAEDVVPVKGKKGPPMAIFNYQYLEKKKKKYINNEMVLPEKCRVLLYTDGLVEAFGVDRDEKPFEEGLFTDILKKLGGLPCRELVKALYEELVKIRGNDSFDDDICMICVDVN